MSKSQSHIISPKLDKDKKAFLPCLSVPLFERSSPQLQASEASPYWYRTASLMLVSLLLFFTSVSSISLWATWGELLFPAFCRCWEYSQKWWVIDERDLESFAFCRSPEHGFLRRSFRNMAHKMATDPNTLHTHHLPIVPCASPPKADECCAHNWALRGPLQVSRFPAQRNVWLVHTFVNFMRQRQSHCLWVRQLNDLLSKGYSTCAFLSTNQARAMPSDSSNNPNGNLVLNSLSDTTILLRQNSDRFGWQGRNASF